MDSLKTHKWSLQSALPFLPPSFDFHNQATSILSKVATSAEIEAPTSTYELVGLDCMFDQGGKLWLLEVQNRPNLLAWSGLDRRIKSGLVDEVKEVRMGRGAVGGGGTSTISTNTFPGLPLSTPLLSSFSPFSLCSSLKLWRRPPPPLRTGPLLHILMPLRPVRKLVWTTRGGCCLLRL